MPSNHSILWNDSTPERDKALVEYLVKKIVAGKSVPNHYEECIDKILKTIRTQEWQQQYPNRTFAFSVFYALRIDSIVEIKLSLYAQALELIYFHLATANSSYGPRATFANRFDNKLLYVFREIYEWELPSETADAIRIIRNDVAHTGTIAGVVGSNKNNNDARTLEQYFTDYEFNRNQGHTDVGNRIHLAHSFGYLMQDILMRVLGLDQNDLKFNGAPAWRPAIFGYDHENRPQWLRSQ